MKLFLYCICVYRCLCITFGAQAQSCAALYALSQPSPNEVEQIKIDSLTGAFTVINNTTLNNNITPFPATLAIDADGKTFYWAYDTNIDKMLSIDTDNGSILGNYNFQSNNNVNNFQYHCQNEVLFGIQQLNNGTIQLVQYAPSTTGITPVGAPIMMTGNGILGNSSSLDSANDLFYISYYSASNGSGYIGIFNTNTGAYSEVPVPANSITINIESNFLTGQALYLNDNYDLYQINPVALSASLLGSLPVPLTGPSSEVAFDAFTNRLFVCIVGDPAATYNLLTFNATSLESIGAVTLPDYLQQLTISQPCQAIAEFSYENACVGNPVDFTDLSVAASTWQWNFDDPTSGTANTSSQQNPIHTFTQAGTYDVSLSVGGCLGANTTTQQVVITAAPTPTLPDTLQTCANSAVLDPGTFAGASYVWISGAVSQTITVTNPNPIWYWVDISVGLCTVRDSVFVQLGTSGNGQIWTDNSLTLCGNQAVLDATILGANYVWSTGETTQSIVPTQSGNYAVTVIDAGCTISDNVDVTILPAINLDLGENITACGASYVLNSGVSGAQYNWSTGANTQSITLTQGGDYSVTVSVGTCNDRDTVSVFLYNLNINLGADQVLCETDAPPLLSAQVSFNNVPGAVQSLEWQDGSTGTTFLGNQSGIYWAEVTVDACVRRDSVELSILPQIAVELGNNINLCEGNSTLLDASVLDGIYQWSNGETSATLQVSSSGDYSVSVSNGACTVSDAVSVLVQNLVVPTLSTDLELCPALSETIVLNAGAGFASYQWLPGGETSQSISPSAANTYTVTVTDDLGCSASGSAVVTERCEAVVLLPIAFSPNGDDVNDELKPLGRFVSNYKISIFNKWGIKVFESLDFEKGWDGFHKGTEQPVGVYVWQITYTPQGVDAEPIEMKGNVTLIR